MYHTQWCARAPDTVDGFGWVRGYCPSLSLYIYCVYFPSYSPLERTNYLVPSTGIDLCITMRNYLHLPPYIHMYPPSPLNPVNPVPLPRPASYFRLPIPNPNAPISTLYTLHSIYSLHSTLHPPPPLSTSHQPTNLLLSFSLLH